MENQIFQKPKIRFKKAYKTNGNLALLHPKTEKSLQNIEKALARAAFARLKFHLQNTL